MNKQTDDLTNIVDLQRHPIHALKSAQDQQFLADCQAHMATHGWLNLYGFVREGAINTLGDEVNRLLPYTVKVAIRRNIYGAEAEDAESKSNLARHELTYHTLYLADDQIPDSAQVKQLYCRTQSPTLCGACSAKRRLPLAAKALTSHRNNRPQREFKCHM